MIIEIWRGRWRGSPSALEEWQDAGRCAAAAAAQDAERRATAAAAQVDGKHK